MEAAQQTASAPPEWFDATGMQCTWPMRSHGILATLATMRAPTISSAPPTAYGGMFAADGKQDACQQHALGFATQWQATDRAQGGPHPAFKSSA